MIRVGLGCSSLTRVGGVTTYTQSLLDHYHQQPDLTPVPCYFKHLVKFSTPRSLSEHLIFPWPYVPHLMAAKFLPLHFSSKIESQCDLFHATDYLIPKFKQIPVVATIHDAAPLRYPQWCNPQLRGLRNWVLTAALPYADHVITISQAMIPDLVRYWKIKENNISVTSLGIDKKWLLSRTEKEKSAVLEKYQLNPDYLLYVGDFQPRKNVENIIRAYLKLPEFLRKKHHLLLLGNLPWKNPSLEKALQDLTNSQTGRRLPHMSWDELQALMQGAKIFVFPSLYEGFGLPILEAFASKVPVITSDIPACKEVSDGAALLVDPYAIDSITTAMKNLLQDDGLHKTLIEKGYQKASTTTDDQCAKATRQVYQSLLKTF